MKKEKRQKTRDGYQAPSPSFLKNGPSGVCHVSHPEPMGTASRSPYETAYFQAFFMIFWTDIQDGYSLLFCFLSFFSFSSFLFFFSFFLFVARILSLFIFALFSGVVFCLLSVLFSVRRMRKMIKMIAQKMINGSARRHRGILKTQFSGNHSPSAFCSKHSVNRRYPDNSGFPKYFRKLSRILFRFKIRDAFRLTFGKNQNIWR